MRSDGGSKAGRALLRFMTVDMLRYCSSSVGSMAVCNERSLPHWFDQLTFSWIVCTGGTVICTCLEEIEKRRSTLAAI